MPDSSTISITYDGTDITGSVLFADANFELQAGALPGSFQFRVRDESQTMSFVTGKEVVLTVDGVPLFGGYLTSVTWQYAFPVVDTVTHGPSTVKTREFTLRGVDYNIMFDRRFLRNPADYLHLLPSFTKDRMDGDLIRNEVCAKYLDIPAGFTTDDPAHVEDVVAPFDPLNEGQTGIGLFLQQGSSWRAQMEDFAQFSGAVYYLSGSKYLEYHALETTLASFGFSDTPDGSTFIGFRDLELVEDGSVIVNDAMIWGGSQFAGSGQTVFARVENGPSIADHQRWQRAEIHFAEKDYMLQSGVTARADVLVNGAPGAVGGDPSRGLRFPQWQARLSWFSRDVPGRAHLVPGAVVTFNFWVLSEDGGATPLTQVLPLRQLSISFPELDEQESGNPYVIFTGTFGLQLSDPFTLWSFLRHALNQVQKTPATLATSSGAHPEATYGTLFSGPFASSPDGSTTQFSLPNGWGYIAGTSAVYKNGSLLIPAGVDYDETDPLGGLVTFSTAPGSGDTLWMRCYLT